MGSGGGGAVGGLGESFAYHRRGTMVTLIKR